MPSFHLAITIELRGPLLTQSSAPAEAGLDTVMAREHGRPGGRPLLAHSLVKGRLRQSLEELHAATGDPRFSPLEVGELLGPNPDFGGDLARSNEPQRAAVEFSDFLAEPPPSPSNLRLRHRVAIDGVTGAADEHMLLVQESLFPSGSIAQFAGTARVHAPNEARAAEIRDTIRTGLLWTLSFGAEHTIGFGIVENATVGDPAPSATTRLSPAIGFTSADSAVDLVVSPSMSFCFAQHRREDNLFVSRDEISGAAIKGCVAETLKRLGELPHRTGTPHAALARHFDDLVFRHALPVPEGTRRRPVAIPQSVVKTSAGWFDLASFGRPGLVGEQAPEFQVDWKSGSDVRTEFGWPNPAPRRELRVRTAIDRERLRAADEMLFAQERVVPDGFEWLAQVDCSAVTDDAARLEVLRQLETILGQGLQGLGKTKAQAKVEVLRSGAISPACSHRPPADGLWILTLQTSALLGWPEEFEEADPRHGAAYPAVWDELGRDGEAEPCLRLKHYYARQTMAGGGYLYHRFQRKHDQPYNPWLLTTEGSVFVLETIGDPARAAARVQALQSSNLPIPRWARNAYRLTGDPGQDWRRCPYLPQNGSGEIQVNLACHAARRPEDFTPLIP